MAKLARLDFQRGHESLPTAETSQRNVARQHVQLNATLACHTRAQWHVSRVKLGCQTKFTIRKLSFLRVFRFLHTEFPGVFVQKTSLPVAKPNTANRQGPQPTHSVYPLLW